MKPEDQAWADLQRDAATRLRAGFADRVVRAAHGPGAVAWRQLEAQAAARLSTGFAERVLRAARAATELPSFRSQLALSAATAALCLGAVLVHHHRKLQLADARNLAEWRAIVTVAQDFDPSGR